MTREDHPGLAGLPRSNQPAARGRALRAGASLTLLASAFLLPGCEVDGWLGDPSVVGRWEHTPTVVPVLERIDIIEGDTGEFVDVTSVTPADLIPEPIDYRVSPGDFLHVEIWDIVQPGFPAPYDLAVTPRGNVDLPQIGTVNVDGLTAAEVRQKLEDLVRQKGLVGDSPVISVTIPGQRQAVYSIFGAVQQPGRFGIGFPDFRLLEALTDAGGVSPVIKNVYVIRQVPLSESMRRGIGAENPRPQEEEPFRLPSNQPPQQPKQGVEPTENINDLIEELTAPDGDTGGSPGAFSGSRAGDGTTRYAPALLQDEAPPGKRQPPLIDLPDSDQSPASSTSGPSTARTTNAKPPAPSGQWVFMNGRWVQVMPADSTAEGLPEGPNPLGSGETTAEDLVTQRVIQVPVAPLLRGVAKYNIVIRPGDVIHVSAPEQGVVYALGPGIGRPGTYSLPTTGRLTIQRLVAAAGGLSPIAIPERVDLTRVVGENSQATIRLNVRAIFEGTQPDIRLKPDDMVNFGTNFWATPMAVIRNGFRMSYGFGFLLDRNFGNDVFGAPPTRLQGQ